MYKLKPCHECAMPAPGTKLNVLVLNASLKHKKGLSNTEELAKLVIENMKTRNIKLEIIRLSDKNITVGLKYRESKNDDWPAIVKKIKASDVIIFATPIWWGGRSSLMQRIIERLDALDEEYIASGRKAHFTTKSPA